MSKRQGKKSSGHKPNIQKREASLTQPTEPLWLQLIHRVLALPRWARALIAGLFGLVVTIGVSPLVDYIYLSFFYTEETRVLPSIISVSLGILMYMLGWWLIVGTTGEKPPVRRAVLWYVGVGIFMICLVLVLALYGYSTAMEPLVY